MPTLPNEKKNSDESAYFFMNNALTDIAYLIEKTKWTHDYVLSLPHKVYMAYVRQFRISDMMQTEEGREYLKKVYRYLYPRKHADLSAIRALGGYTLKPIGEDGEK